MRNFFVSNEWKGCKKVAGFTKLGKEYYAPVINGRCQIPKEALTFTSFEVRLYREKGRIPDHDKFRNYTPGRGEAMTGLEVSFCGDESGRRGDSGDRTMQNRSGDKRDYSFLMLLLVSWA